MSFSSQAFGGSYHSSGAHPFQGHSDNISPMHGEAHANSANQPPTFSQTSNHALLVHRPASRPRTLTNCESTLSPNVLAGSVLPGSAPWQHGPNPGATPTLLSFAQPGANPLYGHHSFGSNMIMLDERNQSFEYHMTSTLGSHNSAYHVPLVGANASQLNHNIGVDRDILGGNGTYSSAVGFFGHSPVSNPYDSSDIALSPRSNAYEHSSSFSSTDTADMFEPDMVQRENLMHMDWQNTGATLAGHDPSMSRIVSPELNDHMQFPATRGHHSSWQPLGSMPGVPSCQPDTVSPKLLQLRSTPTPSSSSESMRTSYLSPGDGVGDYHTHNPNTDALRTVQTIASSKPRTMLPDYPRVLLSNLDTIPSSSDEKTSRHDNGVAGSAAAKRLIKPKGKSRRSRQSASPRLASSRINAAGRVKYAESEHDRKVKDDFLIQGRAKGLTFKQIKEEGGYLEAESTLRGRFRTLTKPAEKRLRNPRWYPVDVRLLEEAVRKLSANPYDILPSKVPWAKVAEYIDNNGGTYLFGNATCKARWDQLVSKSLAKGFDPTRSFHEQQQEDDERNGVMQQSSEVEEAAAIGSSDDPFYSDGEHHMQM